MPEISISPVEGSGETASLPSPPKKTKTLTVVIELADDTDIVTTISHLAANGNVRSINYGDSYDPFF